MASNPKEPSFYEKRKVPREEDIRGPFLRDQTAIIHSLPFRRLKHKTQVFFAPENDHICTRIEHVMHVATVASTIARGLNRFGWNLKEEMAFAIGLGHDLGHPPFGHSGEHILDEILREKKETFVHEVNGLRVVDHLANDGAGLNLTYGVRDGIICHNGEKFEPALKPAPEENRIEKIKNRQCLPSSYEGCIVRFSDKIAYLGRDIEDAMDAGLISEKQIPARIKKELGDSNGEIIHCLVLDVIEHSRDSDEIRLSEGKLELMNELRNFNYQNIYLHPRLKEYESFCRNILRAIFDHLGSLLEKFGKDYQKYEACTIQLDRAFGKYLSRMERFYDSEGGIAHRMVADYISGMTDHYALNCIQQITLPAPLKLRPA